MILNKLLFLTLIFFTPICQAHTVNKYSCNRSDSKGIEISIKNFLNKGNTIAYKDVVVLSKRCAKNFAKATVHPKKPVTDDATVYLQKKTGRWHVLSLGTDFDKELLRKIPEQLRTFKRND